jgi:hypothetical protein
MVCTLFAAQRRIADRIKAKFLSLDSFSSSSFVLDEPAFFCSEKSSIDPQLFCETSGFSRTKDAGARLVGGEGQRTRGSASLGVISGRRRWPRALRAGMERSTGHRSERRWPEPDGW